MSDAPIEPVATAKRKKRLVFAFLALGISLIAPLTLLGAMMATSVGYFDFETGFSLIALEIVPKLAMVGMGVALLSLLISLFMAPTRYGPWALLAVLFAGGTLAGYYVYELRLKSHPPIYDVATSWDRPVTYSTKFVEFRGPDAHPIEDDPFVPRRMSYQWSGQRIAAINAETCPGAQPIPGRTVTADQVAQMLKDEGYVVFGRSDWRVEATYEDPFWGFKSDMVVRLDPDATDIRSVSREVVSDMGGNCRRVTRMVERIKSL